MLDPIPSWPDDGHRLSGRRLGGLLSARTWPLAGQQFRNLRSRGGIRRFAGKPAISFDFFSGDEPVQRNVRKAIHTLRPFRGAGKRYVR
jgi:hypothetical protein